MYQKPFEGLKKAMSARPSPDRSRRAAVMISKAVFGRFPAKKAKRRSILTATGKRISAFSVLRSANGGI
jgi:hypothetical protein